MLTKKIRQKDRVIENGKLKIDNEVPEIQKSHYTTSGGKSDN